MELKAGIWTLTWPTMFTSSTGPLRHHAAAKSLQSCLTLCDPTDGSPPGSPVPGILQAWTLEWVAISFSNAWKWKVKGKSLSRARLLATPWTDCSPPSSSVLGILQARALEWGATGAVGNDVPLSFQLNDMSKTHAAQSWFSQNRTLINRSKGVSTHLNACWRRGAFCQGTDQESHSPKFQRGLIWEHFLHSGEWQSLHLRMENEHPCTCQREDTQPLIDKTSCIKILKLLDVQSAHLLPHTAFWRFKTDTQMWYVHGTAELNGKDGAHWV